MLPLHPAGFDQEAAAVLMARYAVFKCENEARLAVDREVPRKDDPGFLLRHIRDMGFLEGRPQSSGQMKASPPQLALYVG